LFLLDNPARILAGMSLTSTASRRGRPPKFGRPAQLLTLTLPDDVVEWLSTIDSDLGWAIVKLFERTTKAKRGRPVEVADLVQLPGGRALILVQPELFKNFKGVSVIVLSDGRGLLALEAGRGVSDLELSVIDRLDSHELEEAERDALGHLRSRLRQWRQDGVRFESRSIIVADRRRSLQDTRPPTPFQTPRRGPSGA
jgi:hypothetical protein